MSALALIRRQNAMKVQFARFKSTTAPAGTFRPLHPLRGGPGVQPPQPTQGRSSIVAIGNKLADYSQRGLVTVLFGVTIWGLWAIWDVHTGIMKAAEEEYERRKREGTLEEEAKPKPVPVVKPEEALAQAAQLSQENKKPVLTQ